MAAASAAAGLVAVLICLRSRKGDKKAQRSDDSFDMPPPMDVPDQDVRELSEEEVEAATAFSKSAKALKPGRFMTASLRLQAKSV